MLHCVVVALSTGFTSLHAPLRSPHVHGQSPPRPVLHQRAAAAVGVPAVGDEDAAERRASAMEAQSKEIDPVALARGETKQGVHHDAAPCWSQGCRVRRQKGDPAPAAQLFCGDNLGAIQASRISLGSGMGPMQRSARRALRPVMLADDGRVDRLQSARDRVQSARDRLQSARDRLSLVRVGLALFLVLLLFPEAHLDRHAFNILYLTLLLVFARQIQDIEEQDIEAPDIAANIRNLEAELGVLLRNEPPWPRVPKLGNDRNVGGFFLLYEIVLSIYDLGQYIYRA